MKEFFKSIMSIDQERDSILIYILIAVVALLLWKGFRMGDFPPNMLALVEFMIGTVAAINVSKHVTNSINNKNGGGDKQ